MTTEPLSENHSRRIEALEEALTTFIAWSAQSASAPISITDAGRLIDMVHKAKERE